MIVLEIDNNVKLLKNEIHIFNFLYCAGLGYIRVGVAEYAIFWTIFL
jgi:hypothetical protein